MAKVGQVVRVKGCWSCPNGRKALVLQNVETGKFAGRIKIQYIDMHPLQGNSEIHGDYRDEVAQNNSTYHVLPEQLLHNGARLPGRYGCDLPPTKRQKCGETKHLNRGLNNNKVGALGHPQTKINTCVRPMDPSYGFSDSGEHGKLHKLSKDLQAPLTTCPKMKDADFAINKSHKAET